MYYTDVSYADGRLKDTIVNSKIGPVYVKSVYSDSGIDRALCDVIRLRNLDENTIHLKEVDLTPVKLGWVNLRSNSVFATRKPVRAWRQGLALSNISFIGEGGFMSFPLKEMFNTITNNYPTIEDCKVKLKSNVKRVAFSRSFALGKDGVLWYEGRVVGSWGEVFTLNDKDKHLAEHLNSVIEQEVGR